MRSPLFALLRKDFTLFFRNRAALSLTFIVPFVMIWVFGQVFGLNRTDEGPSGIPLALVVQSDHPAALAWVAELKKEKGLRLITERKGEDGQMQVLREENLRPAIQDAAYNFGLVIPADFIAEGRFGLHLKLYSNPRNEIEVQMVNGLLQKTLFSRPQAILGPMLQAQTQTMIGVPGAQVFNQSLAKLITQTFGGDEAETLKRIETGNYLAAPSPQADAGATEPSAGDLFSRILTVDTEQVAGKDVKAPTATRVVSGFAVQFLLFALSSGATALLMERDQGLYHRLLAAPVGRHHILLSRYLQGIGIGVLQLTVLFLGSQLLFGIDVVSHLPLLLLVAVFASAACASFGMLIAAFATTVEAASGLATLLILSMSAIGGAWFPLSLMPEFMQEVAKFTLVYWAMRGFDLVLWNQTGLVPLLGTLGILFTIAAGVMALATWRFSRSRLFG